MKPWLKIHRKMLAHGKFGRCSESTQRLFFLLLLASDDTGALPSVEDAAYQLHTDHTKIGEAMVDLQNIGWIADGRWVLWNEYQSETSAERVARHRAAKRDVTDVTLHGVTVTGGNVTVTDVTPRGEEKREEKNEEANASLSGKPDAAPKSPGLDYERIKEAWNSQWADFPAMLVHRIGKGRRDKLATRARECKLTTDDLVALFSRSADLISGRVLSEGMVDFDVVIDRDKTWTRFCEGKYRADKGQRALTGGQDGWFL